MTQRSTNKNLQETINAYVAEQSFNLGEKWFKLVERTPYDSRLAFNYREQYFVFKECLNKNTEERNFDRQERIIKQIGERINIDFDLEVDNFYDDK